MRPESPSDDRAAPQPPDPAECLRAAAELLARNRWQLLTALALGELIRERAGIHPARSLHQLGQECVARALHDACRPGQDAPLQERAYADLFAYLHRIARSRWPALAEDVAQQALLLVYEQVERCHTPEAFLAFALFKLRHAAQLVHAERPPDDSLDGDRPHRAAAVDPDLDGGLASSEELAAIMAAIARLPDPRQRAAVVDKFLAGLSDRAIGGRLGITPAHVAVLRNRALTRLRADGRLRDALSLL